MIIEENTGRTCRLNGILVVADFDITPETLAPFEEEVTRKVSPLLQTKRYDKVEVGIYKGEVRAWGVTGG